MATDITSVDYLTRTVDRNRYFYGKLMTVRDFLREQEYFNSKRWLINRLLFGSGIVCGLEVTTVGDNPTAVVEIQPGVAFDLKGREITISEPSRVNLSKLDLTGLAPGGKADTDLFVCLNYHECPKEPVPSLGGSPCEEACESNRVGETFTVSLLKAPQPAEPPFPCETWLNRQTVVRPKKDETPGDFQVERVAPVWVRPGEVFEVALKVTALKDMDAVTLSETVTGGGSIIEPDPQTPKQFPTTPVNLKTGEFFVYVYQVRAPANTGAVQLAGNGVVPTPPLKVDVLDDDQIKAREAEMRLGSCPTDPTQAPPVPIAKVTASFNGSNLLGVRVVEDFEGQRFRYSLTRVAELLDCVRASLRAEEDSPRPGHLFITFKDIESNDLKPVGPAADHGTTWTVPRGDHVHALLLYKDSGLEFKDNKLRIEGNVGGANINFLNTVSGTLPTEPQHLTTKGYVDSIIAGLDWQESVRDKDLKTPPASATEGDRYLLFNTPDTGTDWEGHQNSIATYINKRGKPWDFAAPDEGTAVFVDDENRAYLFVDGSWIQFLATPEVAAGKGLYAEGAVLNVGQGAGLKVNANDVEVSFEANRPQPVGTTPAAGTANTSARGDHIHELPLAPNSGIAFGLVPNPPGPPKAGFFINGVVGGPNIFFQHPVTGQTPTDAGHLATKQYVDGVAAGLDWKNSVLDKDQTVPPTDPTPGARYLILNAPPFILGGPPVDTSGKTDGVDAESIGRPPIDDLPPPPPDPDRIPFQVPNPWFPHINHIATWNGAAWDYVEPNEGAAVFVEDDNTSYIFADGSWAAFLAMPSVTAGAGLFASEGARLSVGQGNGLRVNADTVEVIYYAANPEAVGTSAFTGTTTGLARGDHKHELPLATSPGLEFVTTPTGTRLRVNGQVGGNTIEFLNPVLGRDPVDPLHLTTKQYVDGLVSGLTWQSTVLDKDLTKPPDGPKRGDRYLLFNKPVAGTDWEGHQDNIAGWTGRKWDFVAPTEGMAAFVADENLAYLYADGKWIQFLAPPAPVGAGAGLIQQGTDLAVGQGEGVLVSPDAVAVNFGANTPQPVGTTASVGSSRQAAQSDHTHALPLVTTAPGLEFAASPDGPRLRVNGQVGGDTIDFQSPVKGQTPTDARHLVTKQYVDSKAAPPVTAGDGLVNNTNGISVVAGPGLVVNPDEVHVNFEDVTIQPVGTASSAGRSNTVARGDHTHAMPDVWGTNVATGVVAFDMRQAGQQRHITSLPIDPGLGSSTITVVLGLESEVTDEGTFIGDTDQFEDAMLEGGGFLRFAPVLLAAHVIPPTTTTTTSIIKSTPSTRFEIWAQATPRAESLPMTFRVRWWAYRPGKDLGVINYTPPPPSSVIEGGLPKPTS